MNYINFYHLIKFVYKVGKMAKKFIVKENEIIKIEDNLFEIISDEVKHIQVLRYNIGDSIVINNKVFEITKMTKSSIFVKYMEDNIKKNKSIVKINLYMALIKNDMLDLSVKKATELGVDNINLFFSNNVVVKLDEKGSLKKKEKLEKTVIEAVKQCGRDDIPSLDIIGNVKDLENKLSSNDINFFAYEKEKDSLKDKIKYVKDNLEGISSIGIIVGPEGGFTKEEYETIKKFKNTLPVSLGERILRAETAAFNLISIITYEFEKYV